MKHLKKIGAEYHTSFLMQFLKELQVKEVILTQELFMWQKLDQKRTDKND